MGEKNMFKKSKLFDKEGFYIILFVCLCIVAVTAVYMSKYNANTAKRITQNTPKAQTQTGRTTDPVLTQTEGKTTTVPTSKSNVKSTKDVEKEMARTKTHQIAKASGRSKGKKGAAKKVLSSSIFKISYPLKGDVIKKYDNNALQETKAFADFDLWETHEGIDIACELGSPVKAVSGGKIVEVMTKEEKLSATEKNGLGARIVIDHGNGYRTSYSNLAIESMKLKKGEVVKEGEIIGLVGDTSQREAVSTEGSHLHFEVLKKSGNNYLTVDPTALFK